MTVKGHLRLGGVLQPITPEGPMELGEPGADKHKAHVDGAIPPTGDLSAVDPDTGKITWQYKSDAPMLGGVLTTAGNLVFAGEMNGDFNAFNAKTGEKLWHFNLGSGVNAPPITYRVNGKQYIAVAAGGNAANGNNVLMKEQGLELRGHGWDLCAEMTDRGAALRRPFAPPRCTADRGPNRKVQAFVYPRLRPVFSVPARTEPLFHPRMLHCKQSSRPDAVSGRRR